MSVGGSGGTGIGRRWHVAQVLRGWLESELGDAATVYHQGSADPLPMAAAAERFSLSVPVADAVSLVWLTKKRGPVRRTAMVVLVLAVVTDGPLRSEGRSARRDVIVHYRESV